MLQTPRPPLPPEIVTDWCDSGGIELHLKHVFPKIWTQSASRSFGLYWSDAHGLGKLYPEPTPEELERFYDTERYDGYLGGTGTGTGRTPAPVSPVRKLLSIDWVVKIAARLDRSAPRADVFLADHLDPHHAVCDIGCGSGALLTALRPRVASVTGVDPSPVCLGALRKNGIEALPGTAEDLPEDLRGRRFDLVSMQQSLEHCLDPARALANIRSICREGGHCLIEVPNHENFGFRKYGPAWFHTDAGRHVHFFTAQSLCALLRHAGFDALRVDYLAFTRQFLRSWYADMQEVWDGLYAAAPEGAPRRPAERDRAVDLLLAAGRTPAQRYDVLRVYGRAA